MSIEEHSHSDGRDCLRVASQSNRWSWVAFAGDEQSAVRVICERPHPPRETA